MRTRAKRAVLIGAVLLAAHAPIARPHGASRGLHLHLSPDPARPGAMVTVEVEAAEPIERVEVAFSGHDSLRQELDPPVRRVAVELRLPERIEGETINAHAEARTPSGGTLRASAVLRVSEPRGEP
jgi:hypothetical protein